LTVTGAQKCGIDFVRNIDSVPILCASVWVRNQLTFDGLYGTMTSLLSFLMGL
jgi:hypothetical protein